MIHDLQITEVPEIPRALRDRYLASLREGQELYVERLVQRGRNFMLTGTTGVVGYAVLHEQTVVEYHLETSSREALRTGLEAVLVRCRARSVLCKTFDSQMLTTLSDCNANSRVVGLLFRKSHEHVSVHHQVVISRKGTAEDLPTILAMHDGFFDDTDEIFEYLRSDGLWVYLTDTGELTGCGVIRRVVPGRDHADIGMVVSASQRKQGLGTYIVSHLRQDCLARGWLPVCGCSAENHASRRTLENAGFVSEHSLIEFTMDLS